VACVVDQPFTILARCERSERTPAATICQLVIRWIIRALPTRVASWYAWWRTGWFVVGMSGGLLAVPCLRWLPVWPRYGRISG